MTTHALHLADTPLRSAERMPGRHVVLTDHQQQVVESLVDLGRYQNASEVLGDGLRLIQQRDARDAVKLGALREAAQVAWNDLEAGRYQDVTEAGLADYVGRLGVRAKRVRGRD